MGAGGDLYGGAAGDLRSRGAWLSRKRLTFQGLDGVVDLSQHGEDHRQDDQHDRDDDE